MLRKFGKKIGLFKDDSDRHIIIQTSDANGSSNKNTVVTSVSSPSSYGTGQTSTSTATERTRLVKK